MYTYTRTHTGIRRPAKPALDGITCLTLLV